MEARRVQRVAEALREELLELIQFELADPRVRGVEVVEVIPSPDLRKAVVRITITDSEAVQSEALAGLDHAKGFLRKQIAHRLSLFQTPDLIFEASARTGDSGRTDHLLRRIRRGRPRDVGAPGEKSPVE